MATVTGVLHTAESERIISKSDERRVIAASSVGTVFEWYDFYLYAILAPFFAGLFFLREIRPQPCWALSALTPRVFWFVRSAR